LACIVRVARIDGTPVGGGGASSCFASDNARVVMLINRPTGIIISSADERTPHSPLNLFVPMHSCALGDSQHRAAFVASLVLCSVPVQPLCEEGMHPTRLHERFRSRK
jgi:hypothetical protein